MSQAIEAKTFSELDRKLIKQSWMLIQGWACLIILLLLVGGGSLLVPIFPLSTLLLGIYLYLKVPHLYVGFVWFICFVCPLIRRIIDQQSGYVTPGRWGLTAMLVACISCITLFRNLPKINRYGGFPFLLSFIAIAYSFSIGVALDKLDSAYVVGLLEWLGPVAFSFHLFLNWREYPINQRVIKAIFVYGVLIMGVYGIFQFCTAPAWDRFYLGNIEVASFGKPYPFQIRVFSTQSSPQGFASVMMAGLLLMFGSQSNLKFVNFGVGYLSFLLSSARSAWLGWIAGIMIFFPFIKAKYQMQFIATFLVLIALLTPLTQIEPFSETIEQRFESFSNVEDDTSLNERTEGYGEALSLAFSEILGRGLGDPGPSTSLGSADSGILPIMFSFGWFGAVPYMGGLLLLMFQLLQNTSGGQDLFASASRAIFIGMFSQIPLNNIYPDIFGMVMWGFLGIGLAANKYGLSSRAAAQRSQQSKIVADAL